MSAVERGGWWISVGSLPSLGVFLCTFFLPMIESCDTVVSPARISFEDGWAPSPSGLLILPAYGAASILLIVTVIALVRGPGWVLAGVASAALLSVWVANAAGLGVVLWEEGPKMNVITLGFAPATLIAGALVLGTIRGGWTAWALRAGAWWVLMLDHPLTLFVGMKLYSDWPFTLRQLAFDAPVGIPVLLGALGAFPPMVLVTVGATAISRWWSRRR